MHQYISRITVAAKCVGYMVEKISFRLLLCLLLSHELLEPVIENAISRFSTNEQESDHLGFWHTHGYYRGCTSCGAHCP